MFALGLCSRIDVSYLANRGYSIVINVIVGEKDNHMCMCLLYMGYLMEQSYFDLYSYRTVIYMGMVLPIKNTS